ncbi:MAG: hypothetical protein JHD28_07425 [Bacteroidia bacterium]|nr:hypothetical protein [Bacteroidia bacterium]
MDWLKSQKTDIYGFYWQMRGLKEYESIYNETIEEAFSRCGIGINEMNKIEIEIKNAMERTIIHFGEGRLNPSTIAGIFKKVITNLEKSKNLSSINNFRFLS